MPERKNKRVVVCSQEQYYPGPFEFGASYEEGTLNRVIESLRKIRDSIPVEYRDVAHCSIASVGGYEGSHYANIEVSYSRPETDEEMADREARYMRDLNEAKRRELQMLANLQAKYGGT